MARPICSHDKRRTFAHHNDPRTNPRSQLEIRHDSVLEPAVLQHERVYRGVSEFARYKWCRWILARYLDNGQLGSTGLRCHQRRHMAVSNRQAFEISLTKLVDTRTTLATLALYPIKPIPMAVDHLPRSILALTAARCPSSPVRDSRRVLAQARITPDPT